MRERIPFTDGSAIIIYSEHFFDTLDYPEEVQHFLRECLRVLQPSGIFRVGVCDTRWPLLDYVGVGEGRWLQACENKEFYRPEWCKTPLDHVNYHFGTTQNVTIRTILKQWRTRSQKQVLWKSTNANLIRLSIQKVVSLERSTSMRESRRLSYKMGDRKNRFSELERAEVSLLAISNTVPQPFARARVRSPPRADPQRGYQASDFIHSHVRLFK
jgi:hypothetical protein